MRILPALIVISAMLFAVKVGNIWQDVSGSGTSVVAQAAAAEEAAGGKPEPADKAKAAAAAPQPAPKGAGEKGGGEKAGGDKSGGEKGGDGGASDDPRRGAFKKAKNLGETGTAIGATPGLTEGCRAAARQPPRRITGYKAEGGAASEARQQKRNEENQ
jgi:hypothetical protein